MVIDLVILGVALLFGLLGAASGAARQVANVAALAAGFFTARPLGAALADRLDAVLERAPRLAVVVGATLFVFLAVALVVRMAVLGLLRRVLHGGEDREDRGLDHALGFILGAGKVLIVVYVLLCALTFLDDNVTVAGRQLGVASRESQAFALARRFNLFERAQVGAVKDLRSLTDAMRGAARDPRRAERLEKDPAFRALQDDPKVRRVLEDPAVVEAARRGDVAALLAHEGVQRLLADPTIAARLSAAAKAAEAQGGAQGPAAPARKQAPAAKPAPGAR